MYYYCYIRSHELIATAPVRTHNMRIYNRRPSPYAIGTMGRFLRWTMRRRFPGRAPQYIGTHNIIVSHLSDKLSWPESPTASLLQPNAYYYYYCYFCYCCYYYDTKCSIAAVPGVYIIHPQMLYRAITFYRESAKITLRKM